MSMNKNDNIFVNLQIEKDKHSGELIFNVQFDKSSPNFSVDKDIIKWLPTFEEIDFIVEAFELISKNKGKVIKTKHKINDHKSSPSEDDNPETPSNDLPETEVTSFNSLDVGNEDEKSSLTDDSEKEKDEKKIFKQADDKTIDEMLKRKKTDSDEGLITDTDEKTIVDRVLLRQKKKTDEH